MTGILKRPIVTEKMTTLQEKGQYAFEVATSANKISIARAVEKKFNVTVLDVFAPSGTRVNRNRR